tara:strand:- start:667 stop:831 length:165 start_codon:yes stop_codon:yes gene_type:complete
MQEEPAPAEAKKEEGKEEKKEAKSAVWDNKDMTIMGKQNADPIPYLTPDTKRKP